MTTLALPCGPEIEGPQSAVINPRMTVIKTELICLFGLTGGFREVIGYLLEKMALNRVLTRNIREKTSQV